MLMRQTATNSQCIGVLILLLFIILNVMLATTTVDAKSLPPNKFQHSSRHLHSKRLGQRSQAHFQLPVDQEPELLTIPKPLASATSTQAEASASATSTTSRTVTTSAYMNDIEYDLRLRQLMEDLVLYSRIDNPHHAVHTLLPMDLKDEYQQRVQGMTTAAALPAATTTASWLTASLPASATTARPKFTTINNKITTNNIKANYQQHQDNKDLVSSSSTTATEMLFDNRRKPTSNNNNTAAAGPIPMPAEATSLSSASLKDSLLDYVLLEYMAQTRQNLTKLLEANKANDNSTTAAVPNAPRIRQQLEFLQKNAEKFKKFQQVEERTKNATAANEWNVIREIEAIQQQQLEAQLKEATQTAEHVKDSTFELLATQTNTKDQNVKHFKQSQANENKKAAQGNFGGINEANTTVLHNGLEDLNEDALKTEESREENLAENLNLTSAINQMDFSEVIAAVLLKRGNDLKNMLQVKEPGEPDFNLVEIKEYENVVNLSMDPPIYVDIHNSANRSKTYAAAETHSNKGTEEIASASNQAVNLYESSNLEGSTKNISITKSSSNETEVILKSKNSTITNAEINKTNLKKTMQLPLETGMVYTTDSVLITETTTETTNGFSPVLQNSSEESFKTLEDGTNVKGSLSKIPVLQLIKDRPYSDQQATTLSDNTDLDKSGYLVAEISFNETHTQTLPGSPDQPHGEESLTTAKVTFKNSSSFITHDSDNKTLANFQGEETSTDLMMINDKGFISTTHQSKIDSLEQLQELETTTKANDSGSLFITQETDKDPLDHTSPIATIDSIFVSQGSGNGDFPAHPHGNKNSTNKIEADETVAETAKNTNDPIEKSSISVFHELSNGSLVQIYGEKFSKNPINAFYKSSSFVTNGLGHGFRTKLTTEKTSQDTVTEIGNDTVDLKDLSNNENIFDMVTSMDSQESIMIKERSPLTFIEAVTEITTEGYSSIGTTLKDSDSVVREVAIESNTSTNDLNNSNIRVQNNIDMTSQKELERLPASEGVVLQKTPVVSLQHLMTTTTETSLTESKYEVDSQDKQTILQPAKHSAAFKEHAELPIEELFLRYSPKDQEAATIVSYIQLKANENIPPLDVGGSTENVMIAMVSNGSNITLLMTSSQEPQEQTTTPTVPHNPADFQEGPFEDINKAAVNNDSLHTKNIATEGSPNPFEQVKISRNELPNTKSEALEIIQEKSNGSETTTNFNLNTTEVSGPEMPTEFNDYNQKNTNKPTTIMSSQIIITPEIEPTVLTNTELPESATVDQLTYLLPTSERSTINKSQHTKIPTYELPSTRLPASENFNMELPTTNFKASDISSIGTQNTEKPSLVLSTADHPSTELPTAENVKTKWSSLEILAELATSELITTEEQTTQAASINVLATELPMTNHSSNELPPTDFSTTENSSREQADTEMTTTKLPSYMPLTGSSGLHKLDTELPSAEVFAQEFSTTELALSDPSTTQLPTTEMSTNEMSSAENLTTEMPASTTEMPTTEFPSTILPTKELPTTEIPTEEMFMAVVEPTDMQNSEILTAGFPATEYSTTEMPPTIPEVLKTDPSSTELPRTDLPTTDISFTENAATESITSEMQNFVYMKKEWPTTEFKSAELPTTEIPSSKLSPEEIATTDLPTLEFPLFPNDDLTSEFPNNYLTTTQSPTTELPTTIDDITIVFSAKMSTSDLPAAYTEIPTIKFPTNALPTTDLPTTAFSNVDLPTKEMTTKIASVTEMALKEMENNQFSITELPTSDMSHMEGELPLTENTAVELGIAKLPATQFPEMQTAISINKEEPGLIFTPTLSNKDTATEAYNFNRQGEDHINSYGLDDLLESTSPYIPESSTKSFLIEIDISESKPGSTKGPEVLHSKSDSQVSYIKADSHVPEMNAMSWGNKNRRENTSDTIAIAYYGPDIDKAEMSSFLLENQLEHKLDISEVQVTTMTVEPSTEFPKELALKTFKPQSAYNESPETTEEEYTNNLYFEEVGVNNSNEADNAENVKAHEVDSYSSEFDFSSKELELKEPQLNDVVDEEILGKDKQDTIVEPLRGVIAQFTPANEAINDLVKEEDSIIKLATLDHKILPSKNVFGYNETQHLTKTEESYGVDSNTETVSTTQINIPIIYPVEDSQIPINIAESSPYVTNTTVFKTNDSREHELVNLETSSLLDLENLANDKVNILDDLDHVVQTNSTESKGDINQSNQQILSSSQDSLDASIEKFTTLETSSHQEKVNNGTSMEYEISESVVEENILVKPYTEDIIFDGGSLHLGKGSIFLTKDAEIVPYEDELKEYKPINVSSVELHIPSFSAENQEASMEIYKEQTALNDSTTNSENPFFNSEESHIMLDSSEVIDNAERNPEGQIVLEDIGLEPITEITWLTQSTSMHTPDFVGNGNMAKEKPLAMPMSPLTNAAKLEIVKPQDTRLGLDVLITIIGNSLQGTASGTNKTSQHELNRPAQDQDNNNKQQQQGKLQENATASVNCSTTQTMQLTTLPSTTAPAMATPPTDSDAGVEHNNEQEQKMVMAMAETIENQEEGIEKWSTFKNNHLNNDSLTKAGNDAQMEQITKENANDDAHPPAHAGHENDDDVNNVKDFKDVEHVVDAATAAATVYGDEGPINDKDARLETKVEQDMANEATANNSETPMAEGQLHKEDIHDKRNNQTNNGPNTNNEFKISTATAPTTSTPTEATTTIDAADGGGINEMSTIETKLVDISKHNNSTDMTIDKEAAAIAELQLLHLDASDLQHEMINVDEETTTTLNVKDYTHKGNEETTISPDLEQEKEELVKNTFIVNVANTKKGGNHADDKHAEIELADEGQESNDYEEQLNEQYVRANVVALDAVAKEVEQLSSLTDTFLNTQSFPDITPHHLNSYKMPHIKTYRNKQQQQPHIPASIASHPQTKEEITTTNWWHSLPYTEIRKFLNSIFDSVTTSTAFDAATGVDDLTLSKSLPSALMTSKSGGKITKPKGKRKSNQQWSSPSMTFWQNIWSSLL